MQNAKLYSLSAWRCKSSLFLLALIWCAGLISGCITAIVTDSSFYSMMRAASQRSVSIVGLITVSVLPFLLTAIAVYFRRPYFLLPIVFVDAFLWSFSSMLILLSFGSGGWLVRFLLLFSDCCITPVLYWVWLHFVSGNPLSKRNLIFCCVWLIAITAIDYFAAAPYLVLLIN